MLHHQVVGRDFAADIARRRESFRDSGDEGDSEVEGEEEDGEEWSDCSSEDE